MKHIQKENISKDWKKVQFNEKYENNWTLKYRIHNNKEAQLGLIINKLSGNCLITESFNGNGSDYYDALRALCINMGIVIKEPRGKRGIDRGVLVRKRPISNTLLDFYKEVIHRIYNYLIYQDLIIAGKNSYTLYSFSHKKDIAKIKNFEQLKKSELTKNSEHLYFIDVVHLNTKENDDVIEILKIHGKTRNKQYTSNLLHNNDTSRGIVPHLHYKLHDDPFVAREYLDNAEYKNIHNYRISVNYLLKPFKRVFNDRDGLINYCSKNIIFKISTISLSNNHVKYNGFLKCNLLGVRDRVSFESLHILGILEKVINYLYQLLLSRDVVSIVKTYNRSLADFDRCLLDSKIANRLRGILSHRLIENFTNY